MEKAAAWKTPEKRSFPLRLEIRPLRDFHFSHSSYDGVVFPMQPTDKEIADLERFDYSAIV
jgi:hypothetical protein